MFQIVTDSTADLPADFYSDNNIIVNQLMVTVDDQVYGKKNSLDIHGFYECMRMGIVPKTKNISAEQVRDGILRALDNGDNNVLYITCLSKLGGSYEAANIAADIVKDERPDANIVVIDAHSSSMGQGILVYEAARLRKIGNDFEWVCDYIKNMTGHVVNYMTVNDVKYLKKASLIRKNAYIFSPFKRRPVLNINDEGQLVTSKKLRSRKKSLDKIVDMMGRYLGSFMKNKDELIGICHGDCIQDAEYVKRLIAERFGMKNIMVLPLGPSTGSFAGPGAIALFFLGEGRQNDHFEMIAHAGC